MTIEEFSKQLVEKSLHNLDEKSGTCNSTGAGTSCPRHGDADCNSSKQNRSEGLMADELDGTTYEVVVEDGETIIIEKIKGADGKACWKGYKYAGTENGKDKCVKSEEKDYLPGSQEKLDANKNGKLDADDFKKLRAKKGKTVKEMWQVAEGKKVEIEIMPQVDTPNDPEPPKSQEDLKKKTKKKQANEQVELEEKKLSAK